MSGRRYYGDDDLAEVRVKCDIDLETVRGRPGETGGLELNATTGWSTCDEVTED